LDGLFASHRTDAVESFLLDALAQTDDLADARGRLAVLAELIGFYRSRGRHGENLPLVQQSIELALSLGLEGTPEFTATLINAATELRAAGRYEQAEDLYRQALAEAESTLTPGSRELAALHNNLALLYQDTDRHAEAVKEFAKALAILGSQANDGADDNAATHSPADVDIASTHANLALSLLSLGRLDEALEHATTATAMYATGLDSAHRAAAEATEAQVHFMRGELPEAQRHYTTALGIIRERYGADSEYYRVTRDNLSAVAEAMGKASAAQGMAHDIPATTADATSASEPVASSVTIVDTITGLDLARAYWEECGRPMIAGRYADVRGRIAAGLVGHGSECYGFDDAISRDHDFGPGFCIWLTDGDYASFGTRLQSDYDALPRTFRGFGPRLETPRAGKRVGVFRIGEFFESVTGLAQAPDDPRMWVTLDEPTLAAATNGRVFADPVGAFSHARQAFRNMPDGEILRRISQRLGMAAQAGQANLPRMARRGDAPAAHLCVAQFCTAVTSLVFLLNNPMTVGYMPYYKWQFAALRRLSERPGMRLTGVCAELEALTVADPLSDRAATLVDSVCRQIVHTLRAMGLTRSDETFLDWHRPYVEELMRAAFGGGGFEGGAGNGGAGSKEETR
ncbi:DUF4037 domain-containing protein, partial [Pseudoscardovia radai]|uniref:DUF4037 domain-containing protein n=1 Tax=Pseudoscardovia radai TaxID=987066 RepID=UPI0039945163